MGGLTPGVRNGGSVRQSPSAAPATHSGTIMVSTAGVESYVELAANTFLARSSSGAAAAKSITDFGLSLIDDADAATARTTLGITAGIGGTTGGTDNAILRADGTGGSTIQTSTVTIDDNGVVAGVARLNLTAALNTVGISLMPNASTADPTNLLQTYDVDGTTIRNGITSRGIFCRGLVVGSASQTPIYDQSLFHSTMAITSAVVRLASNIIFGWNSSASNPNGSAIDTGIARNAAGVAEINTGVAGTLATLTALLRPAPYTFATVPTVASHTGSAIRITDRAQRWAYSDGTNWRFTADDVIIS